MKDKPVLIFYWLLFCIGREIMESKHFRAGDGPQRSLINPCILQMTELRPSETKWLWHDHKIRAKIRNQVTEISIQFSLFYIILHKSDLRCSGMLWCTKTEFSGEFWSKRNSRINATKDERKMATHPINILREIINLTSLFFSPLAHHLYLGLTKLLVWPKSMLVFSR